MPQFDVLDLVDIVSCKCSFYVSIVYVFVIYFTPGTPVDQYQLFFEMFESLEFLYGNQLLIMRDFNIPELVTGEVNHPKLLPLNNFQAFFDLNRCNVVYNCLYRMLDLVFCNIDYSVTHNNASLVAEHAYPSLFIVCKVSNRFIYFTQNKNQRNHNFTRTNYIELYVCYFPYRLFFSIAV